MTWRKHLRNRLRIEIPKSVTGNSVTGTVPCHISSHSSQPLFSSKMSKKWGISCRCREIYISLPHITIKSTLMTHAGHRAYKKVDQKNRPCDLFRLHPSMALRAEIFAEYCYSKGKIALFLNLCSGIIITSIFLIISAHRTINVGQ